MTWQVLIETLLNNTIMFATPLILAALGGVISERSGVVNIALEGFMIAGAFAAAITTIYLGETMEMGKAAPWIALLAAFLLGLIFAIPFAVASIHFRADQVVAGVALNFLAAGFTIFMVKILFDGAAQTTTIQYPFDKLRSILSDTPLASIFDIPIIGKGLLNAYPTSYLAFILVVLLWVLLYKTSFGLRIRAIGEHPHAAASVGISVFFYRYVAVLLAGGLAGLGGAGMSIAISNNFQYNTIAGQGFMALAAMIFGKWHPVGAMGAALFFGFANALAANGQVLGLTEYVPAEFLNMLPFVLTILALAGVVGKAQAPAADGKPYVKGER